MVKPILLLISFGAALADGACEIGTEGCQATDPSSATTVQMLQHTGKLDEDTSSLSEQAAAGCPESAPDYCEEEIDYLTDNDYYLNEICGPCASCTSCEGVESKARTGLSLSEQPREKRIKKQESNSAGCPEDAPEFCAEEIDHLTDNDYYLNEICGPCASCSACKGVEVEERTAEAETGAEAEAEAEAAPEAEAEAETEAEAEAETKTETAATAPRVAETAPGEAQECENSNGPATDAYDYDCSAYKCCFASPDYSHDYDDADFTAADMCASCKKESCVDHDECDRD